MDADSFYVGEYILLVVIEININSIPLAVLWSAEVAAWLFFLARMLMIVPRRLRMRFAGVVVACAGLAQLSGVVHHINPRTLALMAISVALSVPVSSLLMPGSWRDYLEVLEKFGERSRQMQQVAGPIIWGILGSLAFFAILFLVIFKGAGW